MKVNRQQTIQEAIKSLKFEFSYSSPGLKCENKGEEDVEVEFFKLDKDSTNQEVLEQYKKRNLMPDPFSVIEYVKQKPEVLKEKVFIAVQMENDNYVTLYHELFGHRFFNFCYHHVHFWNCNWWFAGIRNPLESDKKQSQSIYMTGLFTNSIPIKKLTNKKEKNIMSQALDFVKKQSLKLSNPNEFELREADIHNDCGELTESGIELRDSFLESLVSDKLLETAKAINLEKANKK